MEIKNGYFQLVCGVNMTAIKIVLPKNGGNEAAIKEVMEYLNMQGVAYDLPLLNKGMQEAVKSESGEYAFALNQNSSSEVREYYRITVSQDRMKASVRFYPPSLNGERITLAEFLRDLQNKNISFGIKNQELENFISNPEYCTDFVIAEGIPPRHGTDAQIEYLFETDLHAKPTLNEDGSVDFFHLNSLNHCKKGDVLARMYPEDQGDYGCSVFNEKIKPRDVKRASFKHGRNITISEDRQMLISDVDGHVALVDSTVFVSDVLEVENVDTATGNIEYEGSVIVSGNVCTNFSVSAKGNIEVRGVVEGASLEAGGNIVIIRGMNGMARGNLKADGNIIAKFIENAKVSAKGFVSTESILHSEVMAGTEILVSGKRGFITGGRVSAANMIQVKTLGSPMGADTIVEVGADPSIKLRIKQLQQLISEEMNTIKAIKPVLTATTKKLSQGIKLQPEQVKYIQELIAKEKQAEQDLQANTKEIEELQGILGETVNAKIEVTGEVYSGTKICIADVSMVVKNSMKYCKFVKSHGDVKMTAL